MRLRRNVLLPRTKARYRGSPVAGGVGGGPNTEAKEANKEAETGGSVVHIRSCLPSFCPSVL